MDYLRQVQRAVDYIEDHLDEGIALRDISKIAGVSHWHFQRMFRALTSETLKGYIRSRRLSNARAQLLTTDRDVLEVALGAGFDSQASFTRAFKSAFGAPPGRYRASSGDHLFLEKAKLDEAYLEHLHDKVSLIPAIAHRPERHMVGLSTQFYGVDSHRNNIGEKLPQLWGSFIPRLGDVPAQLPGTCFGVISQVSEDDELLHYTAAVEVGSAPLAEEIPAGMSHVVVPSSTYAQFTHRGDARSIDHTVNYIYSSWLLQSGRRHSYGADLEVYGPGYADGTADSVMGYAIPLVSQPE